MGKKLSLEEYLEIEKRHIDCAFDIITQSQCKYLTIGYVADYDNIGYRYKDRIPVERASKVLRDMLRSKGFCVLVNLRRKVVMHVGYDYYMYALCPLEYEDLQELVNSHNLYLNPRKESLDLLMKIIFSINFGDAIVKETAEGFHI